MAVCPRCSTEELTGHPSCPRCGTPLPGATNIAAVEGDPRVMDLAAHGPPWRFLRLPILALGILLLATLRFLGAAVPPEVRPIAWALAIVPPVVFIPVVLWLDQHETEPRWLLSILFLWGAFGATLLSHLVNSVVSVRLGTAAAIVISAPVVEELAKSLALFGLVRWKAEEFNGVLDGLVYAAMVGLGFAMTENVLYFGRAALGSLEAPLGQVFWGRAIVSPLAHPLFTSMTALGLAAALHARSPSVRGAAVGSGVAASMMLHHLWNRASLTGQLKPLYMGFFAPILFVLVLIARWAMRRERRVLAEHLASEVDLGVITEREFREVCEPDQRRARLRLALRTGGIGAWARISRFYELVMDLAFMKWRHGAEATRAPELGVFRVAIRLLRAQIPSGM